MTTTTDRLREISVTSPLMGRVCETFGKTLNDSHYQVLAAMESLADADGCFHAPNDSIVHRAGVGGVSIVTGTFDHLKRLGVIEARTDEVPGHWFTDEWWWNDRAPAPVVLAEWDKSSLWAWEAELIRCRDKGVTETALRVGFALALKCHTQTGIVYRSGKKLAEDISRYRSQAEEGRHVLAELGWIVDVGWNSYGSKNWRLVIPQCSCGSHGGVSGASGHTA